MKSLLIPVIFLAGCGTNPATLQAVLDAQTKSRPTISMTCPAGGCTLDYTDPRDRGLKLPTNGYDAFVSVSGQVTGLVGAAVVPYAMGAMAVHGFDALKGSGAVTTTTTTTTTDRHDVVTDSHAAVSTPTVVTQPAPIVVTQPAPVQIPAGQIVVVPAP
jgi:hypothetical protein